MAPRKANPKSEIMALIDELSNETVLSMIPFLTHLVETGAGEELEDVAPVDELEDEPAPRKKGTAPKAAPAKGGRRAAAPVEEVDEFDDLDGEEGGELDEFDDEPVAAPKGRGRRAAVEELDEFDDEPVAAPKGRGRRAAAPVEEELEDEDDFTDEPAPTKRGRAAAPAPKGRGRAAPVEELDDEFVDDDGEFDEEPEPAPRRRAAAPAKRPAPAAPKRRTR